MTRLLSVGVREVLSLDLISKRADLLVDDSRWLHKSSRSLSRFAICPRFASGRSSRWETSTLVFSYLAYRFAAFICRLKSSSRSSEMHRIAFMSARIAAAYVCNCQTETACCPHPGLAPVRRHGRAPVTVVPFSTFRFIPVCLDRGRHGSDAQSSGNTQVAMGNGVGFGVPKDRNCFTRIQHGLQAVAMTEPAALRKRVVRPGFPDAARSGACTFEACGFRLTLTSVARTGGTLLDPGRFPCDWRVLHSPSECAGVSGSLSLDAREQLKRQMIQLCRSTPTLRSPASNEESAGRRHQYRFGLRLGLRRATGTGRADPRSMEPLFGPGAVAGCVFGFLIFQIRNRYWT